MTGVLAQIERQLNPDHAAGEANTVRKGRIVGEKIIFDAYDIKNTSA